MASSGYKISLRFPDLNKTLIFWFSASDSGKVKLAVQRGLEQIRALKNHGMHPRLVTYLATNFGQKVKKNFSHVLQTFLNS